MRIFFNPLAIFDGVREFDGVVVGSRSKAALRRMKMRMNLAKVHGGWNRIFCRLFPPRDVTVKLNLKSEPSFTLRPYTSDLSVLKDVLIKRVYESEILESLTLSTVLDLGSNTGLTALWWNHLSQGARIVCVEPFPANVELLRRNLTGHSNISVIEAAVAAVDSTIEFNVYDADWSHSSIERPGKKVVRRLKVQGLTLQSVVNLSQLGDIDLLKIDIEGAEVEVMPQLSRLSVRPKLLIAEIHPPYDRAAFERDIASAGMTSVTVEGWPDNICVAKR